MRQPAGDFGRLGLPGRSHQLTGAGGPAFRWSAVLGDDPASSDAAQDFPLAG